MTEDQQTKISSGLREIAAGAPEFKGVPKQPRYLRPRHRGPFLAAAAVAVVVAGASATGVMFRPGGEDDRQPSHAGGTRPTTAGLPEVLGGLRASPAPRTINVDVGLLGRSGEDSSVCPNAPTLQDLASASGGGTLSTTGARYLDEPQGGGMISATRYDWSDPGTMGVLENWHVQTLTCDLQGAHITHADMGVVALDGVEGTNEAGAPVALLYARMGATLVSLECKGDPATGETCSQMAKELVTWLVE